MGNSSSSSSRGRSKERAAKTPRGGKAGGGKSTTAKYEDADAKSEDNKITALPLLETGHMVFRMSLWRQTLKQAGDDHQQKLDATIAYLWEVDLGRAAKGDASGRLPQLPLQVQWYPDSAHVKWFNTREDLTLATHLKGKVVVLDFWTYCCINCIQLVPKLHELEQRYSGNPEVVFVGVHSPKFENEKEDASVRDAIIKHEIDHPCVNDPDRHLWRHIGAGGWPSLAVISPSGSLVYITVGGGQQKMNELQALVDSLLLLYAAESDLRQIRRQVVEFTQRRKASSDDDGDGSQQAEPQTTVVDKGKQNDVDDDDEEEDDGQALPPLNRKPVQLALEKDKLALGQAPLRFPHGVAVDREGDRMFVADSGHHRILVLSLDGAFRTAIGSDDATTGLVDGDYATARFHSPLGLSYAGEDKLYVADSENHCIRCVRLAEERVVTVAGTGQRGYERKGGGRALEWSLSNPWDVASHGHDLYIAMAGTHQIWKYNEQSEEISLVSGSGSELNFNHDDDILQSGWAQPSGLSVAHDSKKGDVSLFVADAESSTVRATHFGQDRSYTETIVGGGLDPSDLFAFGDADGKGTAARLQHPLGVLYIPAAAGAARKGLGGSVVVSDTYNHRLKLVDPRKKAVVTLAGTGRAALIDGTGVEAAFAEPTGLALHSLNGSGEPVVVVCDTNNHALRLLNLATRGVKTLDITGVPRLTAAVPEPSTTTDSTRPVPAYLGLQRQPIEATLHVADTPNGQFALKLTAPPKHHISAGEWKVHLVPESWIKLAQAKGRLPGRAEDDGAVVIGFTIEALAKTKPKKRTKRDEVVYVEAKAYFCADEVEGEGEGEDDGGVCQSDAIVFEIKLRITDKEPKMTTAMTNVIALNHSFAIVV